MEPNKVISSYKDIISILDRKLLSKAIERLKALADELPSDDIKLDLNELEANYATMLNFLNNGIIDPEREKVHTGLINKAYVLADKVRISLLTLYSNNFYFECKRRFDYDNSQTFDSLYDILKRSYSKLDNHKDIDFNYVLEDCQEHEETLENLFNRVWLKDFWRVEDYENINRLFSDDNILLVDKASIIGATLLSLFEHFDEKKMLFLFDAYGSDEMQLSQRAIVCIALVIANFPEKILQFPEVNSRLKLYKDDATFVSNLVIVQKQLITTWETEKITKKMKEDIIPSITRFAQKNNIPSNDIISPTAMEDINPEWNDWMHKSGMHDKLRELGDMQQEGADIYMITFSQLKTYPFFAKLFNWFMPFTDSNSRIVKTVDNNPEQKSDAFRAILDADIFCDSDKYSFSFLMSHLPAGQRESIFPQLGEAGKEQIESSKSYDSGKRKKIYCRSFIRDLYRFYNLFYRRNDFENPFRHIELYKAKPLRDIFMSRDILMPIADYLIRNEHYDKATYPLSMLDGKDKEDALEILQKLGLCNQKQMELNSATKYYIRALNIAPNNIWTNHHIANLYRTFMLHKEALPYYKKVEEAKPNSIPLIRELADCLMETGEKEKALNYYYKVEYLENDNVTIRTLVDITETSLICGKAEQAQTYVNKILEKDKSYKSYMLAGHVYWIKGDPKTAFEFYHQSKATYNGEKDFNEAFYNSAIPLLLADIMSENDVSIICDVLYTI